MYLLHAIFLLWAGWQEKDQVRRKRIKENLLLTKRKYFNAPSASPALWILLVSGPHWRTWTWDSGNNNCFIRCWAHQCTSVLNWVVKGIKHPRSLVPATQPQAWRGSWSCVTQQNMSTRHTLRADTQNIAPVGPTWVTASTETKEKMLEGGRHFQWTKKKYVVGKLKWIKFIPVNLSLSKLKKRHF